MSSLENGFEGRIREAMDHYELPYEPSSWKDLEKRLDKANGGDYGKWVALAAASVLIIGGAWAILHSQFSPSSASRAYVLGRFESVSVPGGATSSPDSSLSSATLSGTGTSDSVKGGSGQSLLTVLNSSSGTSGQDSSAGADGIASESGNPASGNLPVNANPSTLDNNSILVRPSITRSCAGTEVDFEVSNGPKEGSYLWNFGDGTFSNQPTPSHRYDKPGVYDVSLSVTDRNSGEISTKTMSGLVTIDPAPTADFEWEFVNGALDEPTVKIINLSEHASSYTWRFEDGSSSKTISPLRAYSEKGKHMVALEVSNEMGCTDTKVKYITINNDYNLMAPEKMVAGKEVFMPEALRQGKMSFKLTIYDGNSAIYETTNKNKGWDGKLPDGTLAQPGQQFPWIVIITNENTHEEKYFSGLLTLIP